MDSLLPDRRANPYYIFAPPYTNTSAGIRVLHLLTHWLNLNGMFARIVFINARFGKVFHPDLLTPELTLDSVEMHFAQGRTPIIIYPEVVSGNPARGGCVVRYVLNYPGLLGGDREYPHEDLVYCFSAQLANYCNVPDNVLHIPALDTDTFNCTVEAERPLTCFYATKFQHAHGQKVFGLPDGCIEITRDQPDSPSPSQIASLLRQSNTFYCFENTALAMEAVLCGCPAVFMPNSYLEMPIALDELGWDGFAWGPSESEQLRARSTLSNAISNYEKTVQSFHNQLASFVAVTQAKACNIPYRTMVTVPRKNRPYKRFLNVNGTNNVSSLRQKFTFLRNRILRK